MDRRSSDGSDGSVRSTDRISGVTGEAVAYAREGRW